MNNISNIDNEKKEEQALLAALYKYMDGIPLGNPSKHFPHIHIHDISLRYYIAWLHNVRLLAACLEEGVDVVLKDCDKEIKEYMSDTLDAYVVVENEVMNTIGVINEQYSLYHEIPHGDTAT